MGVHSQEKMGLRKSQALKIMRGIINKVIIINRAHTYMQHAGWCTQPTVNKNIYTLHHTTRERWGTNRKRWLQLAAVVPSIIT